MEGVLEPLQKARKALATMLACDPEDLALIENATTGVNTVMRSLTFESGDEILVPDHAYQACRNCLDYVAERWGATVVTVAIPFPISGPDVVMEAMMGAVTERTVLAMIDTVTSPTGLRMPFEALTSALEGITRDTVISFIEELGLEIREKRITRDEVYIADEVFFTGTAAEVTPVREVDGRVIGKGSIGPVTKQLQTMYFDQVYGRREQHPEWLTLI